MGSSAKSIDSLPFQEWSSARATIAAYETTIADIRKYGLTFVAGLLTAQGLVEYSSSVSSGYVPESVKFSILVASLTLIAALCLFEKRYTILQAAAVARARLLERTLDMSLTEDTTGFESETHGRVYPELLYLTFVGATLVLGYFVLNPTSYTLGVPTIVVILMGAGVISAIFLLERPGDIPLIDWRADIYLCEPGHEVRLTFTNLTDRYVSFYEGALVWQVKDPVNKTIIEGPSASYSWKKEDPQIPPGGQRTWLWNTSGRDDGAYTVYRSIRIWGTKKPGMPKRIPTDKLALSSDLDPLPWQIVLTKK